VIEARVGASVPRRRSAFLPAFGRTVVSAMRFRVEGEIPDVPKLVVSVAPHTSNWDFIIGMGVMFALDLNIKFLAKHTLFRPPLGGIMRWMGGIPVDRASSHGVVGDAIQAFASSERLLLAIAPEGTRRRVEHFKSGFLHIAQGAHVPLLLVAFDWERRCVRFGPLFEQSDDLVSDLARIESFYAPIRGKRARRSP
jgi:1-acyl-sn-glycerol-3-phosphate acyltransferase